MQIRKQQAGTVFAMFDDFGERAPIQPDVRGKVVDEPCGQIWSQVHVFGPEYSTTNSTYICQCPHSHQI